MESSRGGPLTTFIMMLPLIVVPAIAMLKPAGQEGGLLSELLSAATGQKPDDRAESETAPPDEVDPFKALFGDEEDPGTAVTPKKQDAASFSTEDPFPTDPFPGDSHPFGDLDSADAFLHEFDGAPGRPVNGIQNSPSDSRSPQMADLMKQLSAAGAARTLWFSPDGRSAGFVAFFEAGDGMVRYRFEAVAETREAAVREVLQQARTWQQGQQQ